MKKKHPILRPKPPTMIFGTKTHAVIDYGSGSRRSPVEKRHLGVMRNLKMRATHGQMMQKTSFWRFNPRLCTSDTNARSGV
jgi:hypothetical protein